jgi:hypothetical protein
MTLAQFAHCIGADTKWVQNTAALLRTSLQYSVEQARWLGLIRLLVTHLAVPLATAAELARQLVAAGPVRGRIPVGADSGIWVEVDLLRYHSAFAARLAVAMARETPRQRGRPPTPRRLAPSPQPRLRATHFARVTLANAEIEGTDLAALRVVRVTPAVRELVTANIAFVTADDAICYDSAPLNVARLAHLLASWRAYPRGVALGLPFVMDTITIQTTPVLALTTTHGDVDLVDRIDGVGDYVEALARSEWADLSDMRFRSLSLDALRDAKIASGRPADLARLREIDVLLALRTLGR